VLCSAHRQGSGRRSPGGVGGRTPCASFGGGEQHSRAGLYLWRRARRRREHLGRRRPSRTRRGHVSPCDPRALRSASATWSLARTVVGKFCGPKCPGGGGV